MRIVFAFAAVLIVGACRPAAPEAPPNFLIILTDDQRYDAVGYAGNEQIHTPNLDALAAGGAHFVNAFVTLSICSPSRAALLTGRYSSASGVLGLGEGLAEDETTIAQYLNAAGYRTGHVGKWHLEAPPDSAGFDFASYFTANGPYYNRTAIEEGQRKTAQGFIESYNADQAIQFLEESATSERPFLLMLNTQVPHMNHEFTWPASDSALALYDQSKMPVPATWQDDLSGKPPYLKTSRSRKKAQEEYGYDEKEAIRAHFKRYYAAITDMDAAIGRVLDAIRRLDLRGDTYIFFMSDNGWMMGDHGFTSKVLPYEPSIRVPFAVDGPGVEARVDSRLVLNIDIAPTLLDLAGLPIPDDMHGRSLVPLLIGSDEMEWRKSFLYEAPKPQLGSWPLMAVRTRRWKYIRTFDVNNPDSVVFEELYDLQHDPHETNNLADDPVHADVLAEMRIRLERLQRAIKP